MLLCIKLKNLIWIKKKAPVKIPSNLYLNLHRCSHYVTCIPPPPLLTKNFVYQSTPHRSRPIQYTTAADWHLDDSTLTGCFVCVEPEYRKWDQTTMTNSFLCAWAVLWRKNINRRPPSISESCSLINGFWLHSPDQCQRLNRNRKLLSKMLQFPLGNGRSMAAPLFSKEWFMVKLIEFHAAMLSMGRVQIRNH